MIRKIYIVIFTFIILLHSIAFGDDGFKYSEAFNSKQNKIYSLSQEYKLIASLPEQRIKLFAIYPEHNGMYKGLRLYADDKTVVYNWVSVSNPAFHPKLYLADINGDKKNELIVVLTTSTGSDIHIEEVHVINLENLSEIKAENPLDIIKTRVETSIRKQDDSVIIKVILNNKTEIIKRRLSDAGFWLDNVGFGSWIHYEIENNLLIARLGAQVSPSGFIGEVITTYKFSDNKLIVKDVSFQALEGL